MIYVITSAALAADKVTAEVAKPSNPESKWTSLIIVAAAFADVLKSNPLWVVLIIGALGALTVGLHFHVKLKVDMKKAQPTVDAEVVKKLIDAFDSAIKHQTTVQHRKQSGQRHRRK